MAKKNLTLDERLEEAIVKDGAYEVPGNWIKVKLGAVAKWGSGGTPSRKHPEYYEGEIPWIKTGELNNGYIYDSEEKITHEAINNSSAKIFKKESVLIAMYGATIGKVAMLGVDATTNQACAAAECYQELINNKYLFYYLLSQKQNFIELGKGGAQPNISQLIIKEYVISLPPLQEQQRIVDRIESLFDKLDKAKELIEEARGGFEKRKSSVLIEAFTGVLTEKWRKNNDISNNGLLDNIINQNNKLKKNFSLTNSEELYDIPINWSWIKLKDICEKFKYGTSAKSQTEGKVPVLRMGNLQQGKLVWDSLVYTSDEDEINKYDLLEGDLLFNRTNSPELVGKTSMYNGEEKAIFAGYLIRVRTLSGINSKYINYFMNSIYAKTRCMEVKSDGVSQSNINAEKLGDFDIPLPSSEEQKEIVRILDRLLEEESKIEELTQLEEQIELIKKSILAKAFRGKLGTNSEEDESALELLKGILSQQ